MCKNRHVPNVLVKSSENAFESATDNVISKIDDAVEDTVNTFVKGSNVPKELLTTKPMYSPTVNKWLDDGGSISIKNGIWTYTTSDGLSVTYKNGYPADWGRARFCTF